MDIYKAFLEARSLEEELLSASAVILYNPTVANIRMDHADRRFQQLAKRLGYRVEKIKQHSKEEAA